MSVAQGGSDGGAGGGGQDPNGNPYGKPPALSDLSSGEKEEEKSGDDVKPIPRKRAHAIHKLVARTSDTNLLERPDQDSNAGPPRQLDQWRESREDSSDSSGSVEPPAPKRLRSDSDGAGSSSLTEQLKEARLDSSKTYNADAAAAAENARAAGDGIAGGVVMVGGGGGGALLAQYGAAPHLRQSPPKRKEGTVEARQKCRERREMRECRRRPHLHHQTTRTEKLRMKLREEKMR